MRTRTDLSADQIAALGALVDGRISTNESVLDLHGRVKSSGLISRILSMALKSSEIPPKSGRTWP